MKNIIIENQSGKIRLNEQVTRESIGRLIDEIGKLFGAKASAEGADFGEIMNAAENAVDVLDIEINSPGGSVFDGYTIFHEILSLRDRGVTVNATITGMAASMASVICMACDNVAIVPHGRMMIHNASQMVHGDAKQLRKYADLLESITNDLAGIYAQRTGLEIDEVKSMMDEETWMPAPKAKALGFVDTITGTGQSVEIDNKAETHNSTTSIMSIFMTNKQATEKITGLEARVEELESEVTSSAETLSTVQAEAATLAENVASLTAERDSIAAELDLAQKAIADQENTIAEANAKLETFDDEVENAVLNKVASLGFKGEVPEAHGNNEPNEKTLHEFNSLTPSAKMAFVKSGGKIK